MPIIRKFPLIAVGTVALLALAACTAAPDTGGEETQQSLTVWFPGNSPAEIALVTEQLVPEFESQTGSTVDVTFVDWADISPKLNTAFAAGSAPDVFGHGPAAAAGFVSNDRVVALDDYIATLPEADRADLQSAFDAGIVDGKHYLAPLFLTSNLVVYRTDLLDQAGIDHADLTTWEAVRDAAAELTTPDRSGLLLGTAKLADQQSFAMLLSSAGGSLVSEDGKSPTFNQTEGVEALEFFVSLYQGPDAVSGPVGDDYGARPAAQQPLALGTAAMTILTPAQLQQLIAAVPDLADDLAVLQPPAFGDSEGKTFGGGGTSLFINKDSEVQDLAWEFLSFITSAGVSVEYAQETGNLPSRISASDSDYIAERPQLQSYLEAVPTLVPNPNLPEWIQVRDILSQNLQLALAGQLAPKDALDQAADEAAPLLDQ